MKLPHRNDNPIILFNVKDMDYPFATKFTVNLTTSSRSGKLFVDDIGTRTEVQTPCLAVPTCRGLPKLLCWNQVDLAFHEMGSYLITVPLSEALVRRDQIKALSKAHEHDTSVAIFNFPQRVPRILTFRDALLTDMSVFGGDSSLHLASPGGRVRYAEEDIIEAIRQLKPHLVVCPGEEVPVAANVGIKKQKRSVQRPAEIAASLAKALGNQLNTLPKGDPADVGLHTKATSVTVPRLLMNVQGGGLQHLRTQAAATSWLEKVDLSVRLKNMCAGTYFGGVGYEESHTERSEALAASLKGVRESERDAQLRFVTLCGPPEELVQAVWLGMDIVEIGWFPFEAAERGIAVAFDTCMPPSWSDSKYPDPIASVNELFRNKSLSVACKALDLTSAERFRLDTELLTSETPLKESRAYIHHLLNCNEILAAVLLTQHNLRLYARLMAQLRYFAQRSAKDVARYVLWFYTTQMEAAPGGAGDGVTTACPVPEKLLKHRMVDSYTVQKWAALPSNATGTVAS